MRLAEALRSRFGRTPDVDRWDDHGAEDVVAIIARLAVVEDDDSPMAPATRAAVLGAYAAAGLSAQQQGTSGRALPSAGAVLTSRPGGRHPALILVAAGLLAAISVGTAAAAAPGGPLYATRVAAEALFLPADPASRAAAQLARMDARVGEAEQAASQGNEGATAAALEEYARIATEAAIGPAPGPTADLPLALRLRAQLQSIAGIDAGDPALVAVRQQIAVAAGQLLTTLGQPANGAGPGGGSGPATPGGAPNGSTSPAGSPAATTPAAPASGTPGGPGPASPSQSGGASDPTGPAGPAQGGASPSIGPSGPGGSAGPSSGAASPAPSPTPRASAGGPAPSGGGPGGSGGGSASPVPGGSGSGAGGGPGAGSPSQGSAGSGTAPTVGSVPSPVTADAPADGIGVVQAAMWNGGHGAP